MGRGGTSSASIPTRFALQSLEFSRDCVDVDYDRDSSGLIPSASVSEVKLDRVAKQMFGEQEPLTAYALERLLRALALYEPKHWSPKISPGYYGDEIWSVRLDWVKSQEVEEEAGKLLALTDNKKIERALTLEYGFLLEELERREWLVKEVAIDDLVLGQQDHYRSLDSSIVDRYRRSRTLPYALVLSRDDGRYRVIDGYHRVAAARRSDLAKVPVVVGI